MTEDAQNGKQNGSYDYCDDEQDSDDDKRHEDRIFKGSCSFGQFVLHPCLCLMNTSILCSHRWRRLRKRTIGTYTGKNRTLLLVLALLLAFTQFSSLNPVISSSSGRPLSDETLNQMPVTIAKFDDSGQRDIGGWKYNRRFFHPTDSISLDYSPEEPDFGGLNIRRTEKQEYSERRGNYTGSHKELLAPPRIISYNDVTLAARLWRRMIKRDPHMHSWEKSPEDLQDVKSECRWPNFAKQYNPHCNLIHELALGDDFDPERASSLAQTFDMFYISHGSFRDVWVTDQPFPENSKGALKTTRYKHAWNHETFYNTLNDALVMEKLTGSPRIIDIYAHCGGTVWVEAVPHEVEEMIIGGRGMAKPEDLPEELTPRNDYTVEEKLDLALTMAESIADLHGFRDGVIVHDDVQLCQWLRTRDGRLKLGDFNRAEIMQYNTEKNKYCKYWNGDCYGNYRAPEEFDEDYLNEKIDVFSFGNNIYGLLTGLWVFYDIDDDKVVHKELIAGKRAYIDPRWKERSYIEAKLVELMEKCWIEDVYERIDIFGAVKELREIKKEHEKRKAISTNAASDK